MLSIPVYNPGGEKVAEESIDPADFGGAVNKQLEEARAKQGPGDIESLLNRGDTWTVN